MLIIWGWYSFARRIVGYRADYCFNCKGGTVSHQWRAFKCGHLFWIPILPLGFWKRWVCSQCGKNPHDRPNWVRVVHFLLLAVLAVFALGAWAVGFSPADGAGLFALMWAARVLFTGATLAGICKMFIRPAPDPLLKERLQAVPPLEGDSCALCSNFLLPSIDNVRTCGTCGCRRYASVL